MDCRPIYTYTDDQRTKSNRFGGCSWSRSWAALLVFSFDPFLSPPLDFPLFFCLFLDLTLFFFNLCLLFNFFKFDLVVLHVVVHSITNTQSDLFLQQKKSRTRTCLIRSSLDCRTRNSEKKPWSC